MKVATNQERLNQLFDSDPRTDTAIAEKLGVSKQTISMWRHGTRSPKKSVLVKISKVYGVSIEWLMGFDSPKDIQDQAQIVVPDSERFVKLISLMPQEDYMMVMQAFERADKRLKEIEENQND